MESNNPRKTRTYRILLESLAALQAKETDKASTRGAHQNVDSPERLNEEADVSALELLAGRLTMTVILAPLLALTYPSQDTTIRAL